MSEKRKEREKKVLYLTVISRVPSKRVPERGRGRKSHHNPELEIEGHGGACRSRGKKGRMILIISEGRHLGRLGNNAEISQGLSVEKGSIYSVTFSAARTCAQLESLNVSVPPALQTIDLQMLYNVQGCDPYAYAFEAGEEEVSLVFRNPGMEDDPTCGPIIDDIAIKKLFTPDRPKAIQHISELYK
ncbi:uncharacterized protein LOC122297752 [Carya illinoinensis]|uniref:uncharacterized protein LOC122297752 n=1 Tax=Carya illinoinensis TaxID=32201 RepID=UPI001C726BDD|nr:uncharacterized protein LOC122297752 [Carya illinoinensis]